MKQMEMTFESRQELTDAGIKQAVDHANAKIEGWSDQAYEHLLNYLKYRGGNFQTEEVRQFAENNGLPQPPSNRAWGAVIQRAAKSNIIKKVGFKSTNNASAHGAIAGIWRKVE